MQRKKSETEKLGSHHHLPSGYVGAGKEPKNGLAYRYHGVIQRENISVCFEATASFPNGPKEMGHSAPWDYLH